MRTEGYVVFILGSEDQIVDRLNARVHWCSELDCDQAATLMAVHLEEIDGGCLRNREKTGREKNWRNGSRRSNA